MGRQMAARHPSIVSACPEARSWLHAEDVENKA
jgi:hypothetical protein